MFYQLFFIFLFGLLFVFTLQALSIFLAIVLRALGPDRGRYCDSDEEYTSARVPLLKNYAKQRP